MSNLSDDEKRLLDLMSEISESAWAAGWMLDLEYNLWHIVQTGPRSYGSIYVTEFQIKELMSLSNITGGWIFFDNEKGEQPIKINEWIIMYDKWQVSDGF
jgi:hypothetical protein